MNDVNKGRNTLIILIVIDILINVIPIAPSDVKEVVTRVFFSCFTLFLLYKGHPWAKWLLITLQLLGGIYSLVAVLRSFSLMWLGISLFYIYFGLTLLLSSDVNAFLDHQRK